MSGTFFNHLFFEKGSLAESATPHFSQADQLSGCLCPWHWGSRDMSLYVAIIIFINGLIVSIYMFELWLCYVGPTNLNILGSCDLAASAPE